MADTYPAIADHGLIGDLQTCALVTTDGAIDWFCAPRFDSPSVFGSLLDLQKGGQFSITPVDTDFTTKQLYFPDTGVLITRFMAECGVAEIHDFMPIENPGQPSERHRIVRMVKVPRGEVRLQMEVAPRFDYGRATHTLESTEHGAVFTSGKTTLTLHSTVPLEARENDVVGEFTLRAGDVGGFILESASATPPRHVDAEELDDCFRSTVAAWRGLARGLDLPGSVARHGRPRRDHVEAAHVRADGCTRCRRDDRACPSRSAASATGTIATRGCATRRSPCRRSIGSASSTTRSRSSRGCGTASRTRRLDENGPLRIMYRVDGSEDLEEYTLDNFEGYMGSSPVRIGNGASSQLQLDTYGEMMDAIWHAEREQPAIGQRGWKDLSRHDRLARATTGTSPRKGSGRRAAVGSRSCTAG